MNRIVVGVDIAKRVFQLHWIEPESGAARAPDSPMSAEQTDV